jgi:TRAP-type C4-dicarboxylate transport system permease small subunit
MPAHSSLETWRRRLAILLRGVGRAELFVSVIALVFVVVLAIAQMLLRSLVENAPVWIQEVVQLAIVVSMCAGTGYAFKRRDYISIGIIADRLPQRPQIALDVAAQIAALAFTGMLAWMLLSIADDQLRARTYILGIPRFYFSLPLIIASVSMALTAVYYGIFVLMPCHRGEPESLLTRQQAIDLLPSEPESLLTRQQAIDLLPPPTETGGP